jgi:hypothetical protein
MIMCALDFCRALNERGWLAKLLFKFAVGKYAYREYELLKMHLTFEGYDPEFEYGLQDVGYHKKSMKEIIAGWTK